MRSKRLGVHAVLFAGIVIIGGLAARAVTASPEASPTPGRTEGQPEPTTNQRRVWAASDVFVGRVLGRATGIVVLEPRLPFSPDDPQPVGITVYAVEVLRPLKGTAAGTVLVRQRGDYDLRESPPGDGAALLEIGEVAVFVASFEPDRGWYTLEQGRYGHTRVRGDWVSSDVVAHFAGLVAVPTPTIQIGNSDPAATST